MPEFLQRFWDTLHELSWRGALDIFLIAALIYLILALLRGTTAMSLLRGLVMLFVALYLVARIVELTVLTFLLDRFLTGLLILIPVVFQPEIRRALEIVGRSRVASLRSRPAVDALIDALVRGCRDLSGRRHGALIVVERETGLEDYIATGRRIDAIPSPDLIANVFFRNAPLHDGALIIRGDRLTAAGCTLPLSNVQMEGHLGTRHRAAIGLTERTDAVVVIVSEETGAISIATNGSLKTRLDERQLRDMLNGLLSREEAGGKGRREEELGGAVNRSAGQEAAG